MVYSTSEVGECLSVAHRIVVMRRGKISAEFGPDVTKERIMAASGEVDLQQQLAETYGLQHCEIVSDLHQDELPLRALGAAGSKFLVDEIEQKQPMLIGIGYGRTLEAAVEELAGLAAPQVRFVSLMGGLTRTLSANPHDVINRLAERTGAQALLMPVPFVASSRGGPRRPARPARRSRGVRARPSDCDLVRGRDRHGGARRLARRLRNDRARARSTRSGGSAASASCSATSSTTRDARSRPSCRSASSPCRWRPCGAEGSSRSPAER